METFRPISGFERYLISDHGTIKNKASGLAVKPRKASNGYLRVGLREGGSQYEKPTTLNIHRLVALHFLRPISGKLYVNHIDGDKTNNAVDNLEWCTSKENTEHAINTGLMTVNTKEQTIAHLHSKESRAKIAMFQNSKQYGEVMREANKRAGVTKSVAQISITTGETIRVYDNCYEAASSLFEISLNKDRLIARCARGMTRTAYGFKWAYLHEGG